MTEQDNSLSGLSIYPRVSFLITSGMSSPVYVEVEHGLVVLTPR
jgi:hypothetical protein